jgi:hypothetical protein
MDEPQLTYDAAEQRAVITFPNGHALRVRGVTKEQANAFFEKHAAEFEKRNCVLHTSACFETREGSGHAR